MYLLQQVPSAPDILRALIYQVTSQSRVGGTIDQKKIFHSDSWTIFFLTSFAGPESPGKPHSICWLSRIMTQYCLLMPWCPDILGEVSILSYQGIISSQCSKREAGKKCHLEAPSSDLLWETLPPLLTTGQKAKGTHISREMVVVGKNQTVWPIALERPVLM